MFPRRMKTKLLCCLLLILLFIISKSLILLHNALDIKSSNPDINKLDIEIVASYNPDGCIQCRSHWQNYHQLQCDVTNFVSSTSDKRLMLNAKELMIDTDYMNGCPINKESASSIELYSYISFMIESKLSIFKQIAMIENSANKFPLYPPPKWNDIGIELQKLYTLNNSIEFVDWYIDYNVQNENEDFNKEYSRLWTEQFVNNKIVGVKNGTFDLYRYGIKTAQSFYKIVTSQEYEKQISNANIIVIGSQHPWLEVILLAAGAAHVTTAEYGWIDTQHPKMSYIHPSQFNETFTDSFDIAVSYSSLEHAGLGRYGDPIDPFADIKAMAQISCLVKPNGLFFYGAPTSNDCIAWNAHRYYGAKRLRIMFMQWKIIDVVGNFNLKKRCKHRQPWFVLQNKRGCFHL